MKRSRTGGRHAAAPRTQSRHFAVLAALLLMVPNSALADRFVDPTGDDTANDCSVLATPCATIQHAVGQATAGETVSVAAGTYAEAITVGVGITLQGPQSGVAVGTRTAGSAAEAIIDASGFSAAISISSGNVTVSGFDITGDASTYTGIVMYNASANIPGVTISDNFIHGMAMANPFSSYSFFAYGVFGVTGTAGARMEISGLTISGNEIYELGATGSVAGAAVYLNHIIGASAGLGATITGNDFHDLETRGAPPNVGSGIIIDAGADNAFGIPTIPSSGLDISSNTYSNALVGAAVIAASSTVSEASTNFTNVEALIANLGRHATIDEVTLGLYAKTDQPTGYTGSDAYFGSIQSAITNSDPSSTVDASAGTFTEAIVIDRLVALRGAKAGIDARSRNTATGESILTLPVAIRAHGASIDGFLMPSPGATAVTVDAQVVNVTVDNMVIGPATVGIDFDLAGTAFARQNLITGATGTGIRAGNDGGTSTLSDDVVTAAVIEDNEIVDAPVGIDGYMGFSTIRGNLVRDHTGGSGAGIAGQLANSTVTENTVSGFTGLAGIQVGPAANRPETANTIYKCNDLSGNLFGARVLGTQTALTGVTFTSNNIAGNTLGLVNDATPTLDGFYNWWGCATGPGTAGCDSSLGNVDETPFLTSVSTCSVCFQDADCDDGLICNGAETCNTGSGTCEPGTPPDCSGGGDPQCTVSYCQEGTGCVTDPVADGTACTDPVTCTVPDSCQAGACTPGAGGIDGDADAVCDADDNCPATPNPTQSDADNNGTGDACEAPNDLEVSRIAMRLETSGQSNGRIVGRVTYMVPPGAPEPLDITGPVTVEFADSTQVLATYTFMGGECVEGKRGKAICKSVDGRFQAKFRTKRKIPGQVRLRAKFKKLPLSGPVVPPVTMTVTDVAGDRVGTADICGTAGPNLRCFPFP